MAVAMLTSMRERKDIEKAIRAGVDDYIVKPIEPILLIQKVEQIFLKKPPVRHSECVVPENFKMSASKLVMDTKVIRISEIGIVIQTPFNLSEGVLIDVPLEVFRRLELKPPQMKVIGSHRIDDDNY